MFTDLNIPGMLLGYVCLLFALSVHEAAHGAISNRCGDPSARLLGRVSLNPLAHIDPIGTVVMPLLMMVSGYPFLFGWAKPVPFNPRNLRNMRRDPVFIALAGPIANLLLATLFVFASRFVTTLFHEGLQSNVPILLAAFLQGMIAINLVLAAFNLIPVPPLDGHHVLYYFMPESGQRALEQIGPFGILIAIMVARPLFKHLYPLFERVFEFAGFA